MRPSGTSWASHEPQGSANSFFSASPMPGPTPAAPNTPLISTSLYHRSGQQRSPIISAFQTTPAGKDVSFKESYGPSGCQADGQGGSPVRPRQPSLEPGRSHSFGTIRARH